MRSKLLFTSMSTIVGLFGIFVLFLILVFTITGIDLNILLISAIVFLTVHFLIAPYITDWVMRILYRARFDEQIPGYLTEFIDQVCKDHNMKYPKIGFIDDGHPNAFTYGRTKNDARIIFTRGCFDILTPEEIKTVAAHELGHAVHYDMFFMTVMQIIPLILRWIYEVTARDNTDSESKLAIVGVIAFVLHIITQYIILWFSRIREYYADEFAVRVTRDPHSMSSALVKIGYGLVTLNQCDAKGTEEDNKVAKADAKEAVLKEIEPLNREEKIAQILAIAANSKLNKWIYSEKDVRRYSDKNLFKTLRTLRYEQLDKLYDTSSAVAEKKQIDISSVSALGIFDSKTSKTLAVARCCGSGQLEADRIKRSARWDLWNPWAHWYEIHSTHPRISKRLQAISKTSSDYGQSPYIVFDEQKPKSYMGSFFVDVFVRAFPWLLVIVYFLSTFAQRTNSEIPITDVVPYINLISGIFLLLLGFALFFKLRRGYRNSGYIETNVETLLAEVEVSKVKSKPCILKGTFIGRGSPGYIFSEDFVLRDETGIVFINYKQPLSIMNFFFGAFKAKRYIDKEVVVKGWYKRGPIPYLELYQMEVDGKTRKVYNYAFLRFVMFLLFGIGALVILLDIINHMY